MGLAVILLSTVRPLDSALDYSRLPLTAYLVVVSICLVSTWWIEAVKWARRWAAQGSNVKDEYPDVIRKPLLDINEKDDVDILSP